MSAHNEESKSNESDFCTDDEDTALESGISLHSGPEQRQTFKVATSANLDNQISVKYGYLLKQSKSFQRWRRRYFRLQGRKLYYGTDKQSALFHEIELIDASVAECTTRRANSFQVITPHCRLVLSAETRQEMEKWLNALKSMSNKEFSNESANGNEQYKAAVAAEHVWYVSSHARPTYCNVCRDALSGVAWHGLSCEVCKIRAHKRCATKITARCKWTTLESVGSEVIYEEDEFSVMPHQWVEGNLPVSAKCSVCDRICGSMLRLQDWRCLWCRAMVHSTCKDSYPKRCPLGACRISVLPPVAVKDLRPDATAALAPSKSTPSSPLLVLVSTKSGDSQGVKFMRRFKTLLNPAQVYDLMNGGPEFGLNFFKLFESFRVLVCGGDGSVGWVLSSLDKLGLLSKCQVGVLPLGTGNDLARVLGWGNAVDDETQLPQLIEKFERAHTKMMDRWSVLSYEGPTCYTRWLSTGQAQSTITQYEDSVASHLSKILSSDDNSVVISSAKVLCETVKAFLSKVGDSYKEVGEDEGSITKKCEVLRQKLDNLLKTLREESAQAARASETGIEPEGSSSDSVPEMSPHSARLQHKQFIQREALMCRANSLKKAVRQIIEHAERAVDEQNAQTEQQKNQSALASDGKRVHRKPKRSSLHSSVAGRSSRHSSTSSFSCGSCARSTASRDGRHACPVRSHTVAAGLMNKGLASSGSVDRADSSVSPSPGVASANVRFDLREDSSSPSTHCTDSGVPDDPKTLPQHISPVTSVTIQPPTPSTCGAPGTEREEHPLSLAMLDGTSQSARLLARSPLAQSMDIAQTASDSEVPNMSRTTADVKHSFSDNSLREAVSADYSPASVRKISSSALVRLAEKAASPQKGFLPAFRRGLIASGLTGSSLIAEVLLLNADVLGVAASPLMDFEDIPVDHYSEKRVMNNYFGIGLDAKIALEFHNRREESTDKTRSRRKLYMLYGMLGTKELLQRTYKNLEQRVHLECDGHRIQLPSLQGIVVLNIPSYQGGANFWGNTKSGQFFSPQSFDDKVLEVVAVFGVIHCATSRVIRLQNHRIAQCRHVKIIITGDEPIPMQVDGEAWMQPAGYIQIVHKNRAQVLVRNRQFEATLKTWTERLKREQKPPQCLLQMFTEEESNIIINFLESFNNLTCVLRKACGECTGLEKELNDFLLQAGLLCQKLYPTRKLPELSNLHYHLTDALGCAKQLTHKLQTYAMKTDASCAALDDELTPLTLETLEQATKLILEDIRQFTRVLTMSQSTTSLDQPAPSGNTPHSSPEKATRTKARSKLSQLLKWRPRLKSKERRGSSACKTSSSTFSNVSHWDVTDVGRWLDAIGLSEYCSNFALHDITGAELIRLERRDLKELGITKVGHIKRLQQAIVELGETRPWGEATEESVSSL